MNKSWSHKEFEKRLNLIHPTLKILDKYTYSTMKITIQDELGIKYFMLPSSLIKGTKPSLKSALNETEAFVIKLNSVRSDVKVLGNYINSFTKILIKNEFKIEHLITPTQLLKNANKLNIKTALNKTEYFIHLANTVHNYIYNYNKVIYKSIRQKVAIFCNIHGEFSQEAFHHLRGCGCPKCAKNFARMII